MKVSLTTRLKKILVGSARDPGDSRIFHELSLVAFLAWVGLGSDGLSSSCYGPAEAFKALQGHPYLGIFVALGAAITIFILSASYSHIIELFPSGGGGYLVASKLLSPGWGVVAGSALLIDYVLTITISIASGADAIFSLLPRQWVGYKLAFAMVGVLALLVLNLRGIKEAVLPLVPIFLLFVATHAFAILYAAITHAFKFEEVYAATGQELTRSYHSLGLFGIVFLVMRAYSMGAGTFTGIEAVSNGLAVLREPRIATAKKTMRYMAFSLSITVVGLMVAYLLFNVREQPGMTLNAVLFQSMTASWEGHSGIIFVWVTLLSEALLLFIAAQTGFMDGPRVLANMAIDRWFPTRFAMLSDRLVTRNGILLMGAASLLMMALSNGSVDLLIVFYSINVFITFSLSQLGMVRHWWWARKTEKEWLRKLSINGTGLVLTVFILISVLLIKFEEGGWVTIAVTGALILFAAYIKNHYNKAYALLKRLDVIVAPVERQLSEPGAAQQNRDETRYSSSAKTAAILVNGFNGLGLHTLFGVLRLFSGVYRNFIFVQVGVVDAGNFKGADEMKHLGDHVNEEADKYVAYMKANGFYAEIFTKTGTDVVEEIENMIPAITARFPNVIFFGGQLVFTEDSHMVRLLHNHTVFAVQRKLYMQGIPFIILPIRV